MHSTSCLPPVQSQLASHALTQSKAVFWSQHRHWTHLFLSSSQLVVLSENTDRSQKYTLSQVFIRDGSSNNFLLRCWQVPWQTWFKACRRDMECASGRDSGSEDCCVPAVLILRVTGVCLGCLSLATNPWPSGQNIESESILKLRNFRILHTCCLFTPCRGSKYHDQHQKQPGEEGFSSGDRSSVFVEEIQGRSLQ